MNLIDALNLLRQPVPEDAPQRRVFLACGFTPLHLQTFLRAHLRKVMPQQNFEVETGLYGDLAGNVERLTSAEYHALVVPIEWQDLDPRLGIRSLGGWRAADLGDILNSASQVIGRVRAALASASASVPTYVSMPTLPLPPLFTAPTRQAGAHELRLRQCVAKLASLLAEEPRIRILSAQRMDEMSPPHARFDAKTEMMAGFPYKPAHASAVAELFAIAIQNPAPMKGLITDLDDTLWSGILGEVGVEGVSWNLDKHTHMHGLYQQFLGSLASAGVLVAVASKNDQALVDEALQRSDIIVSTKNLYPIEAHWKSKSESVRRILEKWHVGADAVVFVDDTALELAEVKEAFPQMECIQFPKNNPQAIYDLLGRLRDLFGKNALFEEDAIRLQSLRGEDALKEARADGAGAGSSDDFLRNTNAVVGFAVANHAGDMRAFELINKTNQFNLNGRRWSDSDWSAYLKDPAAFLLTVNYDDKFGPLGKIAVAMGRTNGKTLSIDAWVMSCRAFSRRIEHHSLKYLFERFGAEEIAFDYQGTERNGPLQDFFKELLKAQPAPPLRISRSHFSEHAPPLFHQVKDGKS